MKSTSLYAVLTVLAVALSLSLAASYRARRADKSNSKTWMKDARRSFPARRRREASVLSAAEVKEVVDHHNRLRASEGADNMELMVCSARVSTFVECRD